jgi:hypothetical protein
VQVWSNEISLFRSDVANHAESSRSNYLYANALLRRYRQADAIGLSSQESKETLGLSRHYFERMYQTNPRDLAALVMLYYLDSGYFSALQQSDNWMSKLETLVETRTLQASDWNSLNTLFDCIIQGPCEVAPERSNQLLNTLDQRYPESDRVLHYRYRQMDFAGATPKELLAILKEAQVLSPSASWVYYYLIYEHGRLNDVAGMYEYARLWLQNDQQRYSIHAIKSLFDQAGTGVENSDE